MRKADYAAMAALLARTRADATRAHNLAPAGDDETRRIANARFALAEELARDFARTAAVDRAAFLKACGIDP